VTRETSDRPLAHAVSWLVSVCLVTACGLPVSACASHPSNVLIPTDVVSKGATPVDMLVVSTRAHSSLPGQIYSGERAEGRSLVNIVVSVPPDGARKVGEIQWPRGKRADPSHEFSTMKIAEMAPEKVDGWFLHVAAKRRKVLIFVHGFNNTFEEAAYRFAQIVHDSKADAAPILFTWPSRGGIFEYLYDKDSATDSRDALE
jgi:esterase/lipase superfamily enzyme